MEGLSQEKLILYTFGAGVLTLALAFFALLYQMIAAKADVAGVRDPKQRRRLLIFFWSVTTCLATVVVGAVLIFKPILPAVASSGAAEEGSSGSSPCPCDEGKDKNDPGATSTLSTPELSRPPVKGGKDFLINSVRRDRSRFAIMGTFSGVAHSQKDEVEVSILNPGFYLSGSSSIGRIPRVITAVRVGVGSPSELAKIVAGKRGVADWSDSFPLNLELQPGGKEVTPGPKIDVRIPVRATGGISNKAIIIEIRNARRDARTPLYPGYAISNGTIHVN